MGNDCHDEEEKKNAPSAPSRAPDTAENVSAADAAALRATVTHPALSRIDATTANPTKAGIRFMNHPELDRRTLKAWRKARGLTQTELGRLIGAPDQSIAAWEGGRRKPHIENLQKLADALDILVDQILLPERRPLPYRQRQKEARQRQRTQRQQHDDDAGRGDD